MCCVIKSLHNGIKNWIVRLHIQVTHKHTTFFRYIGNNCFYGIFLFVRIEAKMAYQNIETVADIDCCLQKTAGFVISIILLDFRVRNHYGFSGEYGIPGNNCISVWVYAVKTNRLSEIVIMVAKFFGNDFCLRLKLCILTFITNFLKPYYISPTLFNGICNDIKINFPCHKI